MKRISLAATMLAGYFAIGPVNHANAVDTSRSNTTVNPQSSVPQNNLYNPMQLPGQGGYYGTSPANDPFLNPALSNPQLNYPVGPLYPSTTPVNPQPTVPNPGNYPTAPDPSRNRILPTQPGYTPTTDPSQLKKWRLGVYSKDTDTGVRIYDVVNGGAAYRAGLEINDQIVAVSGYQVGYVNGQLFDCATEFDRSADKNGWVTLLVQDSRNGQLKNIPVQLDSRLSTLNGSIALQNRQNLPANAIVNVELKEIIGNNNNPVTFASTQVDKISQYPIPFSLDYDPAHVASNGRYAVYASVLVNGREVYRTSQLQPVAAQQGGIRTVALQLDQVQPATGPYPRAPQTQIGEEAQIAQIVKWFNDYIGRNPSDRELVAYLSAIRQGQTMAQIQLSLLANENFFNRCDADKRVYIERLHQMLIGRNPTGDELNYWVGRYDAQGGIRRNVAQEFQGALGIY